MTREEVYKAIDSERKYQDRKWKDHDDKKNHMSDWILYIERYLGKLKNALYKNDWFEVQENLRKTAALGVAASEALGIPERYDILFHMDEDEQKRKAYALEQENYKNERILDVMIVEIATWTQEYLKGTDNTSTSISISRRALSKKLAQKYKVEVKTKTKK